MSLSKDLNQIACLCEEWCMSSDPFISYIASEYKLDA